MSLEPQTPKQLFALSSADRPNSSGTFSRIVPIQRVRYLSRPAFILLLATLLGLVLFLLNWVLWGTIILFAVALVFLFLRMPGVSVLLLWSMVFAWYAQLRDEPRSVLPLGQTLYDTEVRLYYPMASSLEGSLYYHAEVRAGNEWLQVRLQLPRGVTIPPEYEYGSAATATLDLSAIDAVKSGGFRRYLLSEGYEAQGAVHRIGGYREQKVPSLRSSMQRTRAGIVEKFDALTQDKLTYEERGLIYALTLGDRSYLPNTVRYAFTSAGVAHILAVSGYHLGVVYAMLALVLGVLIPSYRHRRWRYALLFVGLVLYTYISGASTATLRALLMSSLFLLARFVGRPADAIQVLSLTMLIFLLIEPYSIYSVGLLLSVSAVWGIDLFLPLLQYYFPAQNRPIRSVADIIFVSISAQLGVFPFLLYFFGSASLSFLWSNIPLVLLSGLLIPYVLVLMLIAVIAGSLPTLLVESARVLSSWMISVADFFSHLTMSGLELNLQFDLPLIILYYAILHALYVFIVRQINFT